jgi:hypothetical protein
MPKRGHSPRAPRPRKGPTANEDSPRSHRHCPRGPRRSRGGHRSRRQVSLRKTRP